MLTFNHLDLFSGIGGFALAARWTGWETIAFTEINPYANRILQKHWPGVPNLGDITKWADWPAIACDLVTGGFPCQPYSVAGKRRGALDDRALWPFMLAVIGRYRPRWVCAENVPGIIGMELDRVLSDLEALGYASGPIVIPACAVDAHHRRSRVWIVAHADDQRRDQQRLPIQPRGPFQADPEIDGRSQTVAVAESSRLENGRQGRENTPWQKRQTTFDGPERSGSAWWDAEPDVGRVADGVPNRVDRLRCLGNAIVPQLAARLMTWMKQIDLTAEPR